MSTYYALVLYLGLPNQKFRFSTSWLYNIREITLLSSSVFYKEVISKWLQ